MSAQAGIRSFEGVATRGHKMHGLMAELFPICRSITGQGVRDSLRILGQYAQIEISEVPSGSTAFDWTVPPEWNIRDAFIKDPSGRKIVDFKRHSLHVVSYSEPVHRKMPLAELRAHLHTNKEHPDWIPYRTSYYKRDWGFAITDRLLQSLPEGEYEVMIDSSFKDGSLTYGECFLPGEIRDEILISTHVCHPSMCNDNLSGMVVATFLARALGATEHRHSIRVLFVPGCIGPITWLSRNEEAAGRIRHGLVLTCIGDSGGFTYKRSRQGDAVIDRAAVNELKHSAKPYAVQDFSPIGYDERQYCSTGFNLPVGCLMRTPHGEFAEYHSSADNLDFVQPEHLEESLDMCLAIVRAADQDAAWVNLNPKCEPQLGRRGLYRGMGGKEPGHAEVARLWVLNYSDAKHTLLDIAERSGLPFEAIRTAAEELFNVGLLAPKE